MNFLLKKAKKASFHSKISSKSSENVLIHVMRITKINSTVFSDLVQSFLISLPFLK
jgi:hypothetical protein